jgi:SAM-dependent methyltransferase
MNNSTDYHDFVFKDGKLIGKFEEMYQKSTDVPWHQDKVPDTWHGRIGTNIIEAAFEEGKIKTVLEAGCGYGYILSKIKRPNIQFSGFDISETVIKKARKLHPEFTFFVDDLINLEHVNKYDLVICREDLWYVIYNLDAVIENLKQLIVGGGYLYIGLSFPSLDKPFVGKKILPDPKTLLAKLEKKFDSVALNLLYKMQIKSDGPNFHWLGCKK